MGWDDYQQQEEEDRRKEICRKIHESFGMKEGDSLLVIQTDGNKRHLKLTDLVVAIVKAIEDRS